VNFTFKRCTSSDLVTFSCLIFVCVLEQDAYGSSMRKAFQDAATEEDIVTRSFGFPVGVSATEASSIMKALKKSQFRYVYVASLAFDDTETLMLTALKEETVGDDYLYIFTGLDVNVASESWKIPPGTSFNIQCSCE
jgi:hypothetical protein